MSRTLYMLALVLVVVGAPLVIDADAFKPAAGDRLRDTLTDICREVHNAKAVAGRKREPRVHQT